MQFNSGKCHSIALQGLLSDRRHLLLAHSFNLFIPLNNIYVVIFLTY